MSELIELRNLYESAKALRQTAPVDDDFPRMMHNFDRAIFRVEKAFNSTPKIVCLCGSTKFKEAFESVNRTETMFGNIVLSVGFFGHREGGVPEEIKKRVDELHLRKIDLADEIFVLNVGGYVGESTKREIEYAKKVNKPIRWLEPRLDK